jgi:hypothetical protein
MVLDETVPDELTSALLKYCTAFFHGMEIKLKKPGDRWQGKQLSKDFCKKHQITERNYKGKMQVNSREITD